MEMKRLKKGILLYLHFKNMKIYLLIIATFVLVSYGIEKLHYNEHSLLLEKIINEKQCWTFYNGDIECINFENSKIYVLPYLDTLESEMFLRTSKENPDFIKLQNNLNAIDSINNSFGKPLKIDNKKLKSNFVFKEDEADLVISFTSFFLIEDNKYCVVQIRENEKIWVFKVINKNCNFELEVNLILP